MESGGVGRHWTDDDDLADEIELYGELVVAASESERELTMGQIDKVLGVGQWPGCPSPGRPSPRRPSPPPFGDAQPPRECVEGG